LQPGGGRGRWGVSVSSFFERKGSPKNCEMCRRNQLTSRGAGYVPKRREGVRGKEGEKTRKKTVSVIPFDTLMKTTPGAEMEATVLVDVKSVSVVSQKGGTLE